MLAILKKPKFKLWSKMEPKLEFGFLMHHWTTLSLENSSIMHATKK
jgi:hypothetical protein